MIARRLPSLVQRPNPAGPFAPVLYLGRSEELFAEKEWAWGTRAEAFQFPDYEDPKCEVKGCAIHAACAARMHGGFPVVLTTQEESSTRRERDPRDVFTDLERRALA